LSKPELVTSVDWEQADSTALAESKSANFIELEDDMLCSLILFIVILVLYHFFGPVPGPDRANQYK
jgi:hypothetical protein